MAGETSLTEANGFMKKVYGKLRDLRPGCNILQKKIPFDGARAKKVGDTYQVSVTLQWPNGWTALGSTGVVASTLKQPRPMVNKQAAITPFNSMLEERVAYSVLLRIAGEGEAAFADYATEVTKSMQKSGTNRIEINMLDGQRPLGTVEALADGGSSTLIITFTAATWRPGFWWATGAGTTCDSHDGTNTKNNTGGPLVVTAINAAERKVTFSHSGTYTNEVAVGNDIWFEGYYGGTTSYYEAAGIIAQARNTSTSSMGIDASSNPNWAGNRYDVAGAISFDVVEDAVAQLRDRGVEGPLDFYIGNKGYARLMAEPKTQRVIDSSYTPEKAKQGHKSMSYYGKDVGEVEIINHKFMSQGEFLILAAEDCTRVGSTDMTLGVPNTDADFWFQIPGTPYAGVQLTVDQGTLLENPSHAMHGTGITYT